MMRRRCEDNQRKLLKTFQHIGNPAFTVQITTEPISPVVMSSGNWLSDEQSADRLGSYLDDCMNGCWRQDLHAQGECMASCMGI